MAQRGKPSDEWEELDISSPKSAGLAGATAKLKRWAKSSPNGAKGLAAAVLLLLMVALFGVYIGFFSGEPNKTPAGGTAAQTPPQAAPPATQTPVATQASAPTQAPAPTQAGGGVTPPKSAKTDLQPPKEQAKKDQTAKPSEPPLPEDVARWKKEHYFLARKKNDPKLPLAILCLAQKTQGSEDEARGLIELLKPLPAPESPAAVTTPGAASPPAAQPVPPGPRELHPGPDPAPGAAPRAVSDYAKLVDTIVTALGENGSPPALQTLSQIVGGTFGTDDDKIAVEAALKAMVAHPCAENDAVLLKALTSPEIVRPADRQGPWPAKDLQAKAVELVKMSRSVPLRSQMVKLLPDKLGHTSEANPVRDLLLATNVLNCGAQAALYEKESANKELRSELQYRLEQQLTSYGTLALARLLKIPQESQSGGTPAPGGNVNPPGGAESPPAAGAPDKAPTDPALEAAELLWSEKFRALVEAQLNDLHSLDKEPQLVLLAATIPQDSTRTALSKLLRKREIDGPKALEGIAPDGGQGNRAGAMESGGKSGFPDQTPKVSFPDQLLTDPGFLALVKTLRRRDPNKGTLFSSVGASPSRGTGPRAAPPPPPRNRPARPGAAGGNNNKQADSLKPAQRKALAEQDWMATSAKMVSVWRKRFQAAALAQKKAEEEAGMGGDEAAVKLPAGFAFNSDAKVVASYHVRWPNDAAGQKPSPLEIYYIYAEETNKPKRTVGYYARQAGCKVSDARALDTVAWFDDVRVTPQGTLRSIDLMISWPGNPPSDLMRNDMQADMVIEVMVIEIKAPATRD
jgi:hypothetical protein